jgi:hypothetical protein
MMILNRVYLRGSLYAHIYAPSDRRLVTVREFKRHFHELAPICEIEEIFANWSKISRILFASFRVCD